MSNDNLVVKFDRFLIVVNARIEKLTTDKNMQITESQIQSELIELLKEITEDWEIDEIEILPSTKIVEDLGFVSIDIIQLVVAIEEHFQQQLGFNELLMKNGRYIDDMAVDEIAKFVERKLKILQRKVK